MDGKQKAGRTKVERIVLMWALGVKLEDIAAHVRLQKAIVFRIIERERIKNSF